MNDNAPISPTQAAIKVRIIDLSDTSGDNVVEEIGPFPTVADANLFARRYVRDSVERCRAPGMEPRAVLDAWFAFGEDATVPEAGEMGWKSATELHDFAARRAKSIDRDWRALDPRLHGGEDEDEG
jgi:hypothetical protein